MSSRKLVAYLGLDTRVKQSGEGPARSGRISKRAIRRSFGQPLQKNRKFSIGAPFLITLVRPGRRSANSGPGGTVTAGIVAGDLR